MLWNILKCFETLKKRYGSSIFYENFEFVGWILTCLRRDKAHVFASFSHFLQFFMIFSVLCCYICNSDLCWSCWKKTAFIMCFRTLFAVKAKKCKNTVYSDNPRLLKMFWNMLKNSQMTSFTMLLSFLCTVFHDFSVFPSIGLYVLGFTIIWKCCSFHAF